MDDIAQLWSFFSKMTNLQAIGLVENLSDWYLFNTSTAQRIVWPAWVRFTPRIAEEKAIYL